MSYLGFVSELKNSEVAMNSTVIDQNSRKRQKSSKLRKFLSFSCFVPPPMKMPEKCETKLPKINLTEKLPKESKRRNSLSKKCRRSISELVKNSGHSQKLVPNGGPDISFKLNPKFTRDLRSETLTDSGVSFCTISDKTNSRKSNDIKVLCYL